MTKEEKETTWDMFSKAMLRAMEKMPPDLANMFEDALIEHNKKWKEKEEKEEKK